MARWKLGSAHHLNCVQASQWEYIEEGRKGGSRRKRFDVTTYLDPKDPNAWTRMWGANDDKEGEIIVCFPGKGEAGDIEFLGDPTPEMFPIDDEAKVISATFADHWRYKSDLELNPNELYSQSIITNLQNEMAIKDAKPATVEVAGLADLIAAIGQLIAAPAASARRT